MICFLLTKGSDYVYVIKYACESLATQMHHSKNLLSDLSAYKANKFVLAKNLAGICQLDHLLQHTNAALLPSQYHRVNRTSDLPTGGREYCEGVFMHSHAY